MVETTNPKLKYIQVCKCNIQNRINEIDRCTNILKSRVCQSSVFIRYIKIIFKSKNTFIRIFTI